MKSTLPKNVTGCSIRAIQLEHAPAIRPIGQWPGSHRIAKCSVHAFRMLLCLFMMACFARTAAAQSAVSLIDHYLKQEQEKRQWQSSDIDDWSITDSYTDRVTGITYTYINQRYHHIPVYNAISSVAIRNGEVVHFAPALITGIEQKVNSDRAALNARDAVDLALKQLIGKAASYAELSDFDEENNLYTFDVPEYSNRDVRVNLVYQHMDNRVRLAWNVSIEMKHSADWWNIRIDAMNGSYLTKDNYTVECNAEYTAYAFPLDAPNQGPRTLLCDPHDPLASPLGWHDVDGMAGADFTTTRGNNVYAYEDMDDDDLPGYSPNSLSLQFNYPLNFSLSPMANMDASITNLFYANNRIHDYLHHFGFTEAAGNFQQFNYGATGLGNDAVTAQGFDGGGMNNANFSTPPDGLEPRMQMYLWTSSNASTLSLTNMGNVTMRAAAFSATNVTVTGNVILINDGNGNPADGCSPSVNNISGKVVLIDRGSCTFISKAQLAQASGAIGVIIANNQPTGAISMAGAPGLSIPVVSISQADGVLLKAQLLNGPVVASMSIVVDTNDASFDNGIIAHEYAHGLSNRLTGGPSNTGCLSNAEQGGEGWSDWLALMMTIKPSDIGPGFLNMARAVGSFSNDNANGIRNYPYSTNMTTNPLTYANLGVFPIGTEVHNIGEVWCSALWDMSSFLINDLGFSADPTVATAGNNIAMRLVLEGMKLQPCNPGFLDARDAILVADALLYNNAHRCRIWEAFARRGMGADALQGSSFSATDQTAGFAQPYFCFAPTQVPVAAFTSNFSTVPCTGTVQFTDASTQAFNWLWSFGDGATSILQNPSHQYNSPGTYVVKLVVTNPLGADSVTHSIVVLSPFTVTATATPNPVCAGAALQLDATASGSTYVNYNVSSISYAPISGTLTPVNLFDDDISGALPIGFPFSFYGQTYTDFYIGSNGFVTFSSGQPPTPVYGPSLPSNSMPNNLIALAWNDLNPETPGSSVGYFVDGIAPNRKLVIQYNTYHFGGTSLPFVVQAILSEGSNEIEIHTTTISDASSYDPGATTTQGVEYLDGTRATTVAGRNSAIFAASNDAYRFVPVIAYTYNWTPGNLNGSTQTVTAVSTMSYTVNVSDGSGCIMPPVTTPVVQVDIAPSFTQCPSTQTTFVSPTSCDNTVTYSQAPAASGSPAPSYNYTFSGATTGGGSGDGSGSLFNSGTTHVKVYAVNSCGMDSCSFDVVVIDNITPSIICPNDTTVSTTAGLCATQNWNAAGCQGYGVNAIPFAPEVGAGTSIALGDDMVSGALPIGFNFNFYCNTYSQFYIGSNGFITFSPSQNSGLTVQSIPNTSSPNNLIAGIWTDLAPNEGGTISYYTTGTAPNRKLVVNYENVRFFNIVDSTTFQIVLSESGSTADVFITRLPAITNRTKTQGIENSNGTQALPVTGRNASSSWTAINEGKRFYPILNLATVSDNCSNLIVTNNAPTVFPLGNTTVVWNVMDEAGNTASCSQLVTVVDNLAPVFIGSPQVNNYNFTTQSGVVLEDLTSGATTLIGSGNDDASSAVTPLPFSFAYHESAMSQFSVSSNGLIGFGNTAVSNGFTNSTNNATVNDVIYAFWDDLHTGTNGSVQYKVVGNSPNRKLVIQWKVRNFSGDGNAGFTKTFQAWLFEGTNGIQFVYGAGTNTSSATIGLRGLTSADFNEVTTATHANSTTIINDGNTAWPGNGRSYLFTPFAGCPSNITLYNTAGSCGMNATWSVPTAVDNCGMSSLVGSHQPGDLFTVGSTTVTYTATDIHNNTSNCSFTVTVLDTIRPVITCPGIITSSAPVVTYTVTASDNCSPVTVTYSHPSGSVFPCGTTMVTAYAADGSGNIDSCTFAVQVTAIYATPVTVSVQGCYLWPANGTTYTTSGIYTHTFNSAAGCDSVVAINLTILTGVFVNAHVILNGPYDAVLGLMRDSLRVKGLIPTTEPYSAPPYNNIAIGGPGGETVSAAVLGQSGPTAIVDWVFLELRNANSPSNVVANKRALLRRDGTVVSTDGVSPVGFSTVPNGNYFLSIKHRNHLGVMSASSLPLNGCSAYAIDLTNTNPVYTNGVLTNSPRKLVGTTNTLWSGDANNNKNVKYNGLSNDKEMVLNVLGVANLNNTVYNVYRVEDLNLDGKIRYNGLDNDRAVILNNVGVNTPNVIIFQHTP